MSCLTTEGLAELNGLSRQAIHRKAAFCQSGRGIVEEVWATYELKVALRPGRQAGHPLQHRQEPAKIVLLAGISITARCLNA